MQAKPNLLFILTDQLRFDSMRCYGNFWVQTPNLDRLSTESFIFEHAYVTQPVCTPSRSAIMTGLYPHTNGCFQNNTTLRPEILTIAEMAPEGYYVAHIGKWHLGDEVVPQHGFHTWVSTEDHHRAYYTRPEYASRFSSYHHFLIENGLSPEHEENGVKVFGNATVARVPEELAKASFIGREVSEKLRELGDRPFVMYASFNEPHPPYTGPLNDLYPPEEIPQGPTFRKRPHHNASLLHRMIADYFLLNTCEGHDLRTETGWRRLQAQYWGNVTLVDRAVGRILGTLDETELSDQTIVVFTSDHGDMMGDHGMLKKGVFYDGSIRVPLLVRVPGESRKPGRIEGRFSQIDLVPTLLDLMGLSVPDGLHGKSRIAVSLGEEGLSENDAFVEWIGMDCRRRSGPPLSMADKETKRILALPWRCVVSADGWKMNLNPEDNTELYDLNTDPYEEINLFKDPGQRSRIRDLTERIRHWQERTEDMVSLPAGPR